MSLSFGLNTKSKQPPAPPPKRRPVTTNALGDDSDDEEPTAAAKSNVFEEELTEFDATKASSPKPSAPAPKKKVPTKLKPGVAPSRPPVRTKPQTSEEFGDLSAQRESAAHAQKAEELDPTIYDYDSFHNAASAVSAQRKAAAKQESVSQGPKYMDALLSAAAQRKQDQQVAREKFLQRERENEGEEFKDTEAFVTGAYKEQQEENRKLREEEEKKKEEEEARRRKGGGGMQGFYKNVMADSERRHQEVMDAAAQMENNGLADLQMEEETGDKDKLEELRKKGVNVTLNEEGQVADKRQLLSAGLNIVADPKKETPRPAQNAALKKDNGPQNMARNRNQEQRERQSRMMEVQLEESRKRALEEDQAEKERLEKASKSKKSETDISSARERFLARKREKEMQQGK